MGDEPFDRAGFEAWLVGGPERQALFDMMWRRIMGADMDGALGAYGQRRRSRRAWLAGGAGAALALIGGYMALPSAELFLARPQDYAAAEGVVREVGLADGTRLTLAGGADVRVRYTRHDREVELTRGTIFANVTHDVRRPFHVVAGAGQVTVLGTRFEVSRKQSGLRVAVESGVVRFGARGWFGGSVDLVADQAASLGDTGLKRVDMADAGGVVRWRSGWAEYRAAPMRQVIADLESVSPYPILLADKGLAELRVSGRIRLADPETQLRNLSVIHDFTVRQADGAIILSRNRATQPGQKTL